MHVSFALFADAANLSQEGKLNVLGVFDAVQVGQLPISIVIEVMRPSVDS